MKITKIYLDMDGVIADFEIEYEKRYGERPYDTRTKRGMPDFKEKWNRVIVDQIFATLPKMPDADELVNFLNESKVPVYILSSTSDIDSHQEVQKQKLQWLKEVGYSFPAILVPGKRFKRYHASKHSLLIDDTDTNVGQWLDQGGQAILHTSAKTTIEALRKYELRPTGF